jgi:hypothetical protein
MKIFSGRPRKGGDPYAADDREGTAYGSRPLRCALGRDDGDAHEFNGDSCMAADDLDPHHPALTHDLRTISNLLCLWGLCGKPACRRARQCKRDPRDCLSRYAPLVPDDARDGVAAMFEGKQCGMSYDELRAEAPLEIAAIESWIGLVHAAARAPLSAAQP